MGKEKFESEKYTLLIKCGNDKFEEDILEFYNHLKTVLNPKEAFSVIYHLQESFYLLPDTIEQCSLCKNLIFTDHENYEYFEDFKEWKSECKENSYDGKVYLGTFNKKDECKNFCEGCIDHKLYHGWDLHSKDSNKNKW